MNDLVPLLIGLVGTLIGAAPAVIAAFINRKKTSAEGVNILSAAYVGLVEPQGRIIDRLKAENDECANDLDRERKKNEHLVSLINYLRVGIARLIQQLRDANLDPVWKPTAEDFGDETIVKKK